MGAAPLAARLPLLTQRALARLQQVHTLIWAPLQALLHGAGRVLEVPQGPLAGVPFAALHDGHQPLGARQELALAPSVQVALNGLRREAPRADLLHLACHAQFRGDNPMFSALHLADGALTAEAVERLPLQACTVVLSACDTALSGPDAGDDRVGLVRAFLVAGAARVLASLWPVDDLLTEDFMQRLHAGLAAGQAPAAALRSAQQSLRLEQAHPCHWAAFTLHGGW